MFQSYFHVLHASVKIADLPDLFLFSLEVQLFEGLFSLGRLWLNFCPNNGQTDDFFEEHVSFSIDLYLEVVNCFLLWLWLKFLNIDYFSSRLRLSFFLISRH